jgi:hypothetical protein
MSSRANGIATGRSADLTNAEHVTQVEGCFDFAQHDIALSVYFPTVNYAKQVRRQRLPLQESWQTCCFSKTPDELSKMNVPTAMQPAFVR